MSASELARFRSAVAKSLEKTGTFPFEQPSGTLLRAFRESIIINGKPCTSREFGAPLGLSKDNIHDYQQEARGGKMPAHSFVLALLWWDEEIRALWKKTLPKKDKR